MSAHVKFLITNETGTSYQNKENALQKGLAFVKSTPNTQQVVIKVDTSTTLATNGSQGGRESVRIESKKVLNKGLVIGSFEHMPGSVCGSWPACKIPAHVHASGCSRLEGC